jgi:hypothetical protein
MEVHKMYNIGMPIYFYNRGVKQKGIIIEIANEKLIIKMSDNSKIIINKNEIIGGQNG